MRAPLLLFTAVLALSACKNNDQHDNNMNVDENLTAENIVSMKINKTEVGEHFAGLRRRKIKPAFALTEPRAARKIGIKMDWYGRRIGNLIIKQFPMRRLDMAGLAAYLDTLEATERFIPDLVIIDYFGVVKTDMRDHRLSLGREFEEFRALMGERHMAGLTPQQVNRQGMGARSVRVTHAAEDISLISTADIAITMSATPQEREKRAPGRDDREVEKESEPARREVRNRKRKDAPPPPAQQGFLFPELDE